MSARHLEVQLRYSTAKGHVTVLLVHVDGAGPGIVAQENSEVLQVASLLLEDLAGREDLTLDAANLVLALEVIPELGTSEDLIAVENAHAVERGARVLLSGKLATDDVELSNL